MHNLRGHGNKKERHKREKIGKTGGIGGDDTNWRSIYMEYREELDRTERQKDLGRSRLGGAREGAARAELWYRRWGRGGGARRAAPTEDIQQRRDAMWEDDDGIDTRGRQR